MSKHTPGPWKTEDSVRGVSFALSTCDESAYAYIGHVQHGDKRTPEEREANARLIAAAPELLAVCKLLFEKYPGFIPVKVECLLETAIAKAEGKS